jgi:hypothetical protein
MDGWHKMMEVQHSTIEQHTHVNKQTGHVNNSISIWMSQETVLGCGFVL